MWQGEQFAIRVNKAAMSTKWAAMSRNTCFWWENITRHVVTATKTCLMPAKKRILPRVDQEVLENCIQENELSASKYLNELFHGLKI